MDYAVEIQRIIDALREDNTANKYWKNLVIGWLTRLQPWCLMFYETPSFSDPMPDAAIDAPPADLSAIPPSLREFARPGQIQGDQAVPEQQ